MGSVKRLAEEVEHGLRETLPKLRKTVVSKLALAVGAMLEGQTPHTVELANGLRWKRRVRTCANNGCGGY
jgi:hypothetical protein